MTSTLQARLQAGQFAITAEVTPPLSTRAEDLLAKAGPLRGLADAVNVTDGASARAHMDSTIAAALLVQNGIEPVLQLTTRDRNRIALQSALLGAAAMGVKNVLFLAGDDPKKGDQPEAKAVFDLDSAGLARTAAAIRDQSQLPHGRRVAGGADFFIGLADTVVASVAEWSPLTMRKKIDAGAQFIQTQFCMDAGAVRQHMARLGEHGIAAPYLIGVAPLASAKSGRWMRENLFGTIIPDWIIERMERANDPKAEGRAICVEVIAQLREIEGVAGVHIMAPLNEASIPAVIEAVRSAL